MTSTPTPTHSLIDELRAVLSSVEHARRTLGGDSLSETNELWPRLEKCALRVSELGRDERDRMRPVMLALLDELQQTIAAFDAERHHLGNQLKSAHRNMAAGAAYRQAKAR